MLWWVFAGGAGFAVGGLVQELVDSPRGLYVVLHVTVGGAVAGALQWPALRPYITGAWLWVAASVGGGVAAGVVGVAAGMLAGLGAGVVGGVMPAMEVATSTAGFAAAVSYGTVIGILQWQVLQRRFARSYWWVVASTAGWIVGGLVAGATEGVAGWAVLGAVYGAVTGCAMVGMVARRPVAV